MPGDENKFTTITLRESTKERLQKHGNMGESFDELLNRILDQIEKVKK
jgi:hypothetical protein